MAGLSDENDKFDIRNSSVPFDTILTNINTHDDYKPYNKKTGHFVVPVSGIYAFHAHALRCRYSGPLKISLMHHSSGCENLLAQVRTLFQKYTKINKNNIFITLIYKYIYHSIL